jgi:hypothetical protein
VCGFNKDLEAAAVIPQKDGDGEGIEKVTGTCCPVA